MLKLRNDGTRTQNLYGYGDVPVGRHCIIPDNKYPTVFNKGDVWTVIEDAPAPWETFHEGAPPLTINSGLAVYSSIEIINQTGANVIVVANRDVSRPRTIPTDQFRIITQDREIDALSITGEGNSGFVYVYAT